MIKIIAICLDENLIESEFDELMTYISVDKRERINRFHRYIDAQRTLIGDIAVRYMLCNTLKIENHNLVFGSNEYGKPFLNNYNDIQYNISHSGEWVVCAIDNLPIGLDVEQIKPINMRIAERFFSEEEVGSLLSKDTVEREAFFYDLWTLKESYIKAVGKGLSIPLDSFSIKIDNGIITVCSILNSDNYYFRQYYIDDNYKMAVCSKKDEFPNKVHVINVNELYEEVITCAKITKILY